MITAIGFKICLFPTKQQEQLFWLFSNHSRGLYNILLEEAITAYKQESIPFCIPFVKVATRFPSTKLCSHCGNKQEVTIEERTYICKRCGYTIDRDLNASINIREEGRRILLSST